MRVEPLTPSIGAEISGVKLGDAARDAGLFAEIKALLLQHRVLFLRDQDISRAEHVGFARRFGDLEDHPVAGSDPDHPGLVQIYRSDKRENYENNYHTDGLWRETPAMGCVLRCIECPPVGGDTIWVNMVEAYKNLPDDIKKRIDGLRARSSIEHSFGAVMSPEARRELATKNPPAEHPVVRIHPETGEKVLYVCSFTTHRHRSPNTRCVSAGSRAASRSGTTAARSTTRSWTTGPRPERWNAPRSSATSPTDTPTTNSTGERA
jgi:taurine dioxygenase